MVGAIPAFGPETTLADIDIFKDEVEKALGHLKATSPELQKVIKEAPNLELRDLMKQQIVVYLKTSGMMC